MFASLVAFYRAQLARRMTLPRYARSVFINDIVTLLLVVRLAVARSQFTLMRRLWHVYCMVVETDCVDVGDGGRSH